MERLTIKELAPYLPYGLKVIGFNTYTNKEMVCDLTDRNLWTHIESQSKPLLRPLSSLTEEIEHNGERFVPIDKLELEGYVIGYNGFSITIGQEDGYSFGYAVDVYNQIVQNLFKWHFDVNNLIVRNLALAIDGKEVKP